jgi:hypothetical protein
MSGSEGGIRMGRHEQLRSIEHRLMRLERQSQRLRVIGGILLLSLLASIVIGQVPANKPKMIEAQEFVVRDQEGNLRAKPSTSSFGTVLSFHPAKLPPGVIESRTYFKTCRSVMRAQAT